MLELTKVYYEYTLELVFKRRILINASLGKWKIVLRRTRAQIIVFIGLEAFGISWNGWLTEEDSRADILELTNPLD